MKVLQNCSQAFLDWQKTRSEPFELRVSSIKGNIPSLSPGMLLLTILVSSLPQFLISLPTLMYSLISTGRY